MTLSDRFDAAFAAQPIVAILRGVEPDEVIEIGHALIGAGIQIIEVPLNSPAPLKSIERLAQTFADGTIIGAGTVLTAEQAEQVVDAGGQIVVAPNTSLPVIERALRRGALPLPGWATPSEAFTAYAAGARYLKLFPAGSFSPTHVKDVSAVLPKDVRILAVGGVGSANAADWRAAGAHGFGIGSELYKPGYTAETVAGNAEAVVRALQTLA